MESEAWYASVLLLAIAFAVYAAYCHHVRPPPRRPRRLCAAPHDVIPAATNRVTRCVTVYGNTSHGSLTQLSTTNVVCVELLHANFPRGQYLVDRGNCVLEYTCAGVSHVLTLPVGDAYSSVSIASALTALPGPLVVTFDLGTSRFTLTCGPCADAEFTLLFGTGAHRQRSLCRELGFVHHVDVTDTRAVSPFRSDLSGSRYLHLVTRELSSQHEQGLLAAVSMGEYFGEYTLQNRRFFKPLHLRSLTFDIMEFSASKQALHPYNFNGLWWSMTLEITVLDMDVRTHCRSASDKLVWNVSPVYCVSDSTPAPRDAASLAVTHTQ